MPAEKQVSVTMRVRIGDAELEVSGPPDYVDKKIESFLKEQGKASSRQQLPATGAPVVPGNQKTTQGGKDMSAAQIFRKASPKNDVERGLVAGYFLEKHEGLDSFTTAELVSTLRKAKISPPSNPSDVVAQNIKKGLMMSSGDKDGKRAYVLTSDGEDSVTSTLNHE